MAWCVSAPRSATASRLWTMSSSVTTDISPDPTGRSPICYLQVTCAGRPVQFARRATLSRPLQSAHGADQLPLRRAHRLDGKARLLQQRHLGEAWLRLDRLQAHRLGEG